MLTLSSNPYYNGDVKYSSFNVETFKTTTPKLTGVTSVAGLSHDGSGTPDSIYGSSQKYSYSYMALNHRGYIFAKETGVYTFSSLADDITLIWIGSSAYSGFTRANAFLDVAYSAGTKTMKMTLQQGQYYPFRVVYGNGQQVAKFTINAVAPDGTTFFGSDSGPSPYIVQYSCDGVTAPKYADFGKET